MNAPAGARRKRGPLRVAARLAFFPLGLAAYLTIVFEEWLWRRASDAMARLGRLPAMRAAESALANAPPALAACAFLAPAAALFPFKLAGLFLLAHGHPGLGVAVFLLAKAVGAACLARVWALTQPSLRKLAWLSRTIDWTIDKKNRLKAWASGLWAIRLARGWLHRWRARARTAAQRAASKLWGRALTRARKQP